MSTPSADIISRLSAVALACEFVTTSVTLAGTEMRGHAEDIRAIIARAEAAEALVAEKDKALEFIRDECDWEEGGDHFVKAGDKRIGPACTKALAKTPAEMRHPLKEKETEIAELRVKLDDACGEVGITPTDGETASAFAGRACDELRARIAKLEEDNQNIHLGKAMADGFLTRLTTQRDALIAAGNAMRDSHSLEVEWHSSIAVWDAAVSNMLASKPHPAMSGLLIRVGTMNVAGEEVTGYVVQSTVEEIKALPWLPLYHRVTIQGDLGSSIPHPDTAWRKWFISEVGTDDVAVILDWRSKAREHFLLTTQNGDLKNREIVAAVAYHELDEKHRALLHEHVTLRQMQPRPSPHEAEAQVHYPKQSSAPATSATISTS